jgi:hypothetical protein
VREIRQIDLVQISEKSSQSIGNTEPGIFPNLDPIGTAAKVIENSKERDKVRSIESAQEEAISMIQDTLFSHSLYYSTSAFDVSICF